MWKNDSQSEFPVTLGTYGALLGEFQRPMCM